MGNRKEHEQTIERGLGFYYGSWELEFPTISRPLWGSLSERLIRLLGVCSGDPLVGAEIFTSPF